MNPLAVKAIALAWRLGININYLVSPRFAWKLGEPLLRHRR